MRKKFSQSLSNARTYSERRAFLDWYKVTQGCESCGYDLHPEALQLDHLDPNTKYRTKSGKSLNPGEMVMMSHAVLWAELQKCRVLCANCHAIHTKKQQAEVRRLKKIAKMSYPSVSLVA